MTNKPIRQLVFEALGETSAVFMSQEIKGIEMVMPTEELERIGNNLCESIRKRINNEDDEETLQKRMSEADDRNRN